MTTMTRGRGRFCGTYPNWFYLPAGIVFGVFFVVPTAMAFYFSLTRWTLFNATYIGLENYVSFLGDPHAHVRAAQHDHLCRAHQRTQGHHRAAARHAPDFKYPAQGPSSRGLIFFPVLVSTVAVGITFSALMQPSVGLINTALGALGLPQPDWLGNPDLALYSVALVDVWKGIGIAMVIFIAGILSIPLDYFDAAELEGGNLGEVPSRHHSPGPQRDLHSHPTFVYRRAAIIRPDLDHDKGRAWLRIGRAHVGDLQEYQAGFYGLSTAGNVVLFILVTIIVYPLMRFFNRMEIEL